MMLLDLFFNRITSSPLFENFPSMGVPVPLFDHMVDSVKEAEQALADDIDSINKRSHDIQPQIPIVKLTVALFLCQLRSLVAHH